MMDHSVSASPFVDEYFELSALVSRPVDDLQEMDKSNPPLSRWIARREDTLTAVVTVRQRPDQRMFLSFAGGVEPECRILVNAVRRSVGGDLHTQVSEQDPEKTRILRTLGFETEHQFEEFRVPFAVALRRLHRAWTPSGFKIISAECADIDGLLRLDDAIRQETPGTGGWQGCRDWIIDELDSPAFDPSAYLIGVHQASGCYAGLVRLWRNQRGPRLGLVGVLPIYRRSTLASALLRRSLDSASAWGSSTFTTEVSLSNSVVYRRLRTLETESVGRFFQLVRPGEEKQSTWQRS